MRRMARVLRELVPGDKRRCWVYAAAGAELLKMSTMVNSSKAAHYEVVAGACILPFGEPPTTEKLAEITSLERENFHAWIVETPGGTITDFAAWMMFDQIRAAGGPDLGDEEPPFIRQATGATEDGLFYYVALPKVTADVRAHLAKPQNTEAVRRIVAQATIRLRTPTR